MNSLTIKVNAKINLSLDIKGVFEDGYHSLDMLETSVDIFDLIKVSKSDKTQVYMDNEEQDDSNTATKAAKLLEQAYGYKVEVVITKNIPMKAGLGGSSADAAGVFFAYSKLYGIDLQSMNKLASSIGSDVVYMMQGGLKRVRAKGEIVTPCDSNADFIFVVAQKEYGATTQQVYKEFDNHKKEYNSFEYNNINIFNVLQKPAELLTPAIKEAEKDLLKYTDKVFMTGSGSAYVAIFNNIEDAEKCADSLKDYKFVKTAVSKNNGIEIIIEE